MIHKHRRPLGTLAVAAAISALAAPAASAAPVDQFIPGAAGARDDRAVPVRVVEVQTDRAFDWGDAGIGATGMLALAVIGTGAAVATGHRVRRLNPS
jgi:hypothetical protein